MGAWPSRSASSLTQPARVPTTRSYSKSSKIKVGKGFGGRTVLSLRKKLTNPEAGAGPRDYPQISLFIHYRHSATNTFLQLPLCWPRVCLRSAYIETGSQSQCYVFRESTAESMLCASSTLPKKNSRKIAPF